MAAGVETTKEERMVGVEQSKGEREKSGRRRQEKEEDRN